MMFRRVLWMVFVIAVLYAGVKLLPNDLNITMEKVKESGSEVTSFVEEQSNRINPETWPEPPDLLPDPPPDLEEGESPATNPTTTP